MILTNYAQVSQCGVIEWGILYMQEKGVHLSSINSEISIRSMKNYTKKMFRTTKEKWFPRLHNLYLSKQSLSGLYL